jgi:hypothetical protein
MDDANDPSMIGTSVGSGSGSPDEGMDVLTSPKNSSKRSRRQKVDHACVYCRRSHMTCDSKRPCTRCIKRSIGHLCHDELKPRGKEGPKRTSSVGLLEGEDMMAGNQAGSSHMLLPPTQIDAKPNHDWNGGSGLVPQNMSFSHNNPVFFSEHAGSEFSSLNDFLSMIDDPALLGDSDGLMPMNGGNHFEEPKLTERSHESTPVVSDSARDKFFLTAADPSEDISPEERLKQVIHAKVEAGLLQPFNYANGYTRLQKYMDNYMNHSSKQRILKPLSVFRPAFRAVAQSLKDIDLVLVEEAFERMLLDYDRVFTSMAIPACLWRRTGEIYRGNKEFAGLVEVNVEDLRDGKLAIYELMSEESAVNYWEKYGNIAFDSGQKAVLTSCNLRTRDGRKRRACCFSFTVRRDRYNIPSCIVGNFIPIHH